MANARWMFFVGSSTTLSARRAVVTTFTTQAVNSATSGSSVIVTITAPTSGNVMLAFIGSKASTGTIARTVSTVSGTNITGWSQLNSNSNSAYGIEIWVGSAGASAGTSVTVSMSGAVSELAVNVAEFSGCTAVTDSIIGGSSGTSLHPSTGTYTVNTDSDLLLAAAMINDDLGNGPAGFTPLTSRLASVATLGADYILSSTSGAKSAGSWTCASGFVEVYTSTMAGLKLTASSAANWLNENYWWQHATDSSGVF